MAVAFPGFPPELFEFLRQLARHNDRTWFQAHKTEYQTAVVTPLTDFITAIAPRLKKISPHYVADPRPHGGSMFRIYRDTRFAKDKRPYKEHAACQFRHAAGKDAHAPGFYVHLAPKEVLFGGGVWLPPAPELRRIRDAIARDGGGWKRAVGGKAFKATFGDVHGVSLSRPPRGFDPEDPHIDDIKRKSFFAMRRVAPGDALEANFVDEVGATFRAATPLMKFLCMTIAVPF
ncbi:MAG: DUF2461 domain-containing protein [Alphaproteobacteria bacterium]|nr:DUF2461 domain-containing protein [Alphaproteobacteria bacterium]